jgi:hypothetical protein
MKNFLKFFGVTVLFAVIGFTALLAGCENNPKPKPPPPPPPAEPVQEYHDAYLRHHNDIILDRAQRYTVQRRDSLVSIAKRFYQDGSFYPLIFAASDEVADPDKIELGIILIIPDLALNLNDAKAKKSLDELMLEMAAIEESRGRKKTAEMLRNHTK